MKIRNGFVSNSSSSSFLVILPRAPGSEKDLKQMLFGEREFFPSRYDEAEGWSTLKLARYFMENMRWVSIEEAVTQITGAWNSDDPGAPVRPDFRSAVDREAFDRAMTEHNRERAERFRAAAEGAVVYAFRLTTDGGDEIGAELEGSCADRIFNPRGLWCINFGH